MHRPLAKHSMMSLYTFPRRGLLGGIFGKSNREEYNKSQAKFGKDRNDSYRAEYEKEIRERNDSKMNWNIKNRWE